MNDIPCASIAANTVPLGKIPPATMVYYRLADIGEKDGCLIVAMDDPDNVFAIDDLTKITGKTIIAHKASRDQLEHMIRMYLETHEDGKYKHLMEGLTLRETDTEIIKVVNLILVEGIKGRATGIELRPSGDRVDLRYRTSAGETKATGPRVQDYPTVVRRIKVMSQISLEDSRNSQNGRMNIVSQGEHADIQVTITPESDGDAIVMTLISIRPHNQCILPTPRKGTAQTAIEADTEALGYLPPTSMIYYHAADIGEKDGCLIVAAEEPDNVYIKQDIELITGKTVMLVKAEREQLKQVIEKFLDVYEDGQMKHLKDTIFKDA